MKKQQKPPPTRCWAVYGTTLIPKTLAFRRADAIKNASIMMSTRWGTLKRRGYTCRRVIVTEDVKGSDDA